MTTTLQTFTVTIRGETTTFVSAFPTLAEAYHALAAHERERAAEGKVSSAFVLDLMAAARARQLSAVQVAWVHLLASEATGHRPRAATKVSDLNLLPIVTMLHRAAEAQKQHPAIVLQVPTVIDGGGGGQLKLSLAGEKARQPNTVNLTDGLPYGESKFYGRIHLDGSVEKGRSWTPAIEDLLRRLAADPLHVAAQHGCATGVCCFCNRALSTKESRSAGYGPVCAAKFGLDWGQVSPEIEAQAEAAKVLPASTEPAPTTNELPF